MAPEYFLLIPRGPLVFISLLLSRCTCKFVAIVSLLCYLCIHLVYLHSPTSRSCGFDYFFVVVASSFLSGVLKQIHLLLPQVCSCNPEAKLLNP